VRGRRELEELSITRGRARVPSTSHCTVQSLGESYDRGTVPGYNQLFLRTTAGARTRAVKSDYGRLPAGGPRCRPRASIEPETVFDQERVLGVVTSRRSLGPREEQELAKLQVGLRFEVHIVVRVHVAIDAIELEAHGIRALHKRLHELDGGAFAP
jgi:hypothetical protein